MARHRFSIHGILLTCIALGLMLLATYRWWLPRVDALYLLWPLRSHPGAMTTASPLSLAASPAEGAAYSFGGLAFAVPWKDETHREDATGYTLTLRFGDKGTPKARSVLLLKDPSLRESLASQSPEMQRYFNAQLLTNFATLTYLLTTTPATISFVRWGGDPYTEAVLMKFKDSMVLAGAPVSSFTTAQGIHGFLMQKTASTTVAEFFTSNDQEYTLVVAGANTQEVGAILQSLKEY